MDTSLLKKLSQVTAVCFGLLVFLPDTLAAECLSAPFSSNEQTSQVVERFEVATIRPSGKNDDHPSFQFLPNGVFRARNASLKLLMQVAYELRPEQITGGDGWTDSEPFDVLAKSPESVSGTTSSVPNKVTLKRLQMLLGERFALSLRREPKMAFGYALVVAKSGSKMTISNESGAPLITQKSAWSIKAERVPMSLLVAFLGHRLHINVVDETGLEGRFNFELDWKPELPPNQTDAQFAELREDFDPAAVEQLGLKLNRQKLTTDSYVIVHAATPTEN